MHDAAPIYAGKTRVRVDITTSKAERPSRPVDPTTLTVTFTNGTSSGVYAWPDAGDDGLVARSADGTFNVAHVPAEAGDWRWIAEASGDVENVTVGAFTVVAAP